MALREKLVGPRLEVVEGADGVGELRHAALHAAPHLISRLGLVEKGS